MKGDLIRIMVACILLPVGMWLHSIKAQGGVSFSGGVNFEPWLIVTRHDKNIDNDYKAYYEKRLFDPCYTNLISQYKPIVKKLPNGTWEITFVSEIAQDIP